MRIVIPETGELVSRRLEDARRYRLFEIDGCMLLSEETFTPESTELAADFRRRGVDLVIAGAIRSHTALSLRTARIELILGARGAVREVLLRYLSGEVVGMEE